MGWTKLAAMKQFKLAAGGRSQGSVHREWTSLPPALELRGVWSCTMWLGGDTVVANHVQGNAAVRCSGAPRVSWQRQQSRAFPAVDEAPGMLLRCRLSNLHTV